MMSISDHAAFAVGCGNFERLAGDRAKIASQNLISTLNSSGWTSRPGAPTKKRPEQSDQLLDRLIDFKAYVGSVSMHLPTTWREGFFAQLDYLLDFENWESGDELPKLASFQTLMRTLLYNEVAKRPGLGLSPDGNVIAAWTNNRDRLTIECSANDRLRFSLIRYEDNERQSAAGDIGARFLKTYLSPFRPEVWFG
jgi:hypothetical protein